MFKGVTSEGINREVSSILECVRLNREHDLQSLAIPETALLFLAKENVAKYNAASTRDSDSLIQCAQVSMVNESRGSEPDPMTVLRGILTPLKFVVHRHKSAVHMSKGWGEKIRDEQNNWAKVSVDSKPNTWQDFETFSLDPYGAGDFFCMFCMEELSNIYMHCDGCEKLLNKDFNICSRCHKEGNYKIDFYQMHPFSKKRSSVLNHVGNNMILERKARCRCRNELPCNNCNFCTGCSCKCHQQFTLHYRFMRIDDELRLLSDAESIVGREKIPQSDETSARLFSLLFGKFNGSHVTDKAETHQNGEALLRKEMGGKSKSANQKVDGDPAASNSTKTSKKRDRRTSGAGTASAKEQKLKKASSKANLSTLRRSPNLMEEERRVIPNWALSQTVKWRKLVCSDDPRPVFGCGWCGPKIPPDYDGPLLVASGLCPTCKGFKEEGYSCKILREGNKKTFMKGDKTLWWSNKTYLKGTTKIVAEQLGVKDASNGDTQRMDHR